MEGEAVVAEVDLGPGKVGFELIETLDSYFIFS